MLTPLPEYWDMLNQFDWFYEMSDDYSVWSCGNRRHSELVRISKQSTEHETMYKAFSKYNYSGTSWNTEKQPKPERPV